jgi:NADH dehydrogenase FAD-containing subunit
MTRIALVGCGHAHLAVVARAAAFRDRGIALVLIDPGRFWYSGRGSGVLGGRFDMDAASLDPQAVAERYGAGFVRDRVVGLDRSSRRLLLQDGPPLGYDLVSFNVGSAALVPPSLAGIDAARVKPIGGLPTLREAIAASGRAQRLIVVGGGATGCEIAGNLLYLARTRDLGLAVSLVSAEAELLPGAPPFLQRAALQSLTGRGAKVHLGSAVAAARPGMLRLASGETLGFDRLILATGLVAHPLMGSLGLPVGPGGLKVGPTLQSLGDPLVFAVGDCADLVGYDLPKRGVYGVRAGGVLARNLMAAAEGRALANYRPQRRALSIVDLADGEGLALRGRLGVRGRLALALKHWLDQRFLDRYRRRSFTAS